MTKPTNADTKNEAVREVLQTTEFLGHAMAFVCALDEAGVDLLGDGVVTLCVGGWTLTMRRDKRLPCPSCGCKDPRHRVPAERDRTEGAA